MQHGIKLQTILAYIDITGSIERFYTLTVFITHCIPSVSVCSC